MGQIFVSYSRQDKNVVDSIVGEMEDAGLDVWIDRENIKAGKKTWQKQIVEAIDTCDAFVLMLSPQSAASDNIRREIDLALNAGRTVIIMRLEEVELPAEIRYQLISLQYIDVQALSLEKATDQLVATIKNLQPVTKKAVRQLEIVIRDLNPNDITPEKKELIRDFLAEITRANRSQIQINRVESGSVHVFANMPSRGAYELKTLALNRNRSLKQFGIVSLRLDGDERYVNTSFGILTRTPTLSLLQAIWLRILSFLRSVFELIADKFLIVLLAAIIFVGVGFAIAQMLRSGQMSPMSAATPTVFVPTETVPPIFSPTETVMPVTEIPGFAPFCKSGVAIIPTPSQCEIPIAYQSSVFCWMKSPYNLIIINDGATHEVLSNGFTCFDAGMKEDRQMITCTGPMATYFELKVCDSACIVPSAITRCPQDYYYNNFQGCCTKEPQPTDQYCVVLNLKTTSCEVNCSGIINKSVCTNNSYACEWDNSNDVCQLRQ